MASMVANGNPDGQSLVLKGVDPETCMIVFKNHWSQVNASTKSRPLQLKAQLIPPSVSGVKCNKTTVEFSLIYL